MFFLSGSLIVYLHDVYQVALLTQLFEMKMKILSHSLIEYKLKKAAGKRDKTCLIYIYSCFSGLSITVDITEHLEDSSSSSYIRFEGSNSNSNYNNNNKIRTDAATTLWKKLEYFLQKPTQLWHIPEKPSSHPASCKRICHRVNQPQTKQSFFKKTF